MSSLLRHFQTGVCTNCAHNSLAIMGCRQWYCHPCWNYLISIFTIMLWFLAKGTIVILKMPFKSFDDFYRNQVRSLPCLVTPSVRQCSCWILSKLLDLSTLLNGFLYVVTWICPNWYVNFSKLSHGFVKIDTWISLSCYMDLSKLFYAFLALRQKNKLKFDQDFKPRWSFCFELKVLNEI